MARLAGCRSALSAALCRSRRERAIAGGVSKTHLDGAGNPPVPGRSRFFGSGDADFANGRRRRSGSAIQHAPQSARPRSLSTDRAGTLFEAPARWRVHQSVRAKPEFSERRHFPEAQSGIHHARSLLGLRRFRKNGGPDRRTDLSRRRKDLRLVENRMPTEK